jgi:hypothetical protein
VSGVLTGFEQFLLWERSSRDTLEVKRVYVDMAGDLVAGIVLSQIVYWHLPSREGKARLQVEREGQLWLAKARTDWWAECRVSPKQADRTLDLLRAKGLIEVRLFKFGPAPTKHVRIVHDAFLTAWREQLELAAGGGLGAGPPAGADFTRRGKSISPEGENRLPQGGEIHFDRRGKSQDTETTTETTAAAGGRPGHDAAALVVDLVARGMGRAAAERLAREKPAVCRRCLEYLPYANCRTTPGAWLANAIRDEYGPPAGYLRAKQAERRQAQTRAGADREAHRQSHEEGRRREKTARLKADYGRMQKARGEPYTAFCRYLQRERERAERMAARLSPRRRDEYLDAFDHPDRLMELFERWLTTDPAPAPDVLLGTSAGRPAS